MRRRQFNQLIIATTTLPAVSLVHALDWSNISQKDAISALRSSLTQGATNAVDQLGVVGGFMANPKVQIPLPQALDRVAPMLRAFGQGQRLDELVQAMNAAAEQAIPLAKPMLIKAAKAMSVQDAKTILSGADTAVTDYFANATRQPLTTQFMPAVRAATNRVGAAQRYNAVIKKASGMGLGNHLGPDVETYVTGKALDGLFVTIAAQERALRKNPAAAASGVLRTVFSALQR
jgi:hypothetical protein